MLTSRRFLFLSAVLTLNAFAIGCSATADEEDLESGEDAFSQQQVDNDPVLKALQQKASNVDQYEINVDAIAVPVANASVGADITVGVGAVLPQQRPGRRLGDGAVRAEQPLSGDGLARRDGVVLSFGLRVRRSTALRSLLE